MKRRLPVCALIALLAAPPAHAVVLVEDTPMILQQIKDAFVQGQQYAKQLEQLRTEAQTLGYTINEFEALVAAPNLANAMGLMGTLGISDPLPVSPYAIQGLVSGQGGINGAFGALSSYANSS